MQVKNTLIKLVVAAAVMLPYAVSAQTSSINAFSPYTMYGIGEIVRNLEGEGKREATTKDVNGLRLSWTDFKRIMPSVLRGTALGSFLGILPGGIIALQACGKNFYVDNRRRRPPHNVAHSLGRKRNTHLPVGHAHALQQRTRHWCSSMALQIGAFAVKKQQQSIASAAHKPAHLTGVVQCQAQTFASRIRATGGSPRRPLPQRRPAPAHGLHGLGTQQHAQAQQQSPHAMMGMVGRTLAGGNMRPCRGGKKLCFHLHFAGNVVAGGPQKSMQILCRYILRFLSFSISVVRLMPKSSAA
mgnify:CR=1 FL=1